MKNILFISLLFLFVISNALATPFNSISCFKITDSITFVTYNLLNNSITNVNINLNSRDLTIGVLEQTDSYVSVYYYEFFNNQYRDRIGYYYFENSTFVPGPLLPFPNIFFKPQASFYNQQTNQILIGGIDNDNDVSNLAYDINSNQVTFIQTEIQVKSYPMGGVGGPNQLLTIYSSADQLRLLITDTLTKNMNNFYVQGILYEQSSPPTIYPIMSNSSQIYLVTIDQPGLDSSSVTLYTTVIQNNYANVKSLYTTPYQYSTDFFLDNTSENIIFIIYPNGQTSEIEFIIFNFESNTITNTTTIDNTFNFSLSQYNSYFTR